MAHSKSARKRIRQNRSSRARNRQRRSQLATAVKKLRGAIEAGDASRTEELLRPTLRLIDHTRALGVMHSNSAARTKSRLTLQANRIVASKSS